MVMLIQYLNLSAIYFVPKSLQTNATTVGYFMGGKFCNFERFIHEYANFFDKHNLPLHTYKLTNKLKFIFHRNYTVQHLFGLKLNL